MKILLIILIKIYLMAKYCTAEDPSSKKKREVEETFC